MIPVNYVFDQDVYNLYDMIMREQKAMLERVVLAATMYPVWTIEIDFT